MATKQDSFLKKIRNYFNISISKEKGSSKEILSPGETIINPETKERTFKPIKLVGYLKQIYDWWLSENHDSSETLKHRLDRYKDLEYMYYNDTIISMAVDLYADEATQADEQSEIIGVDSPNKEVRKEIIHLLKKWGYNQNTLHDICHNLALVGDSFRVNSSNFTEGITDTTSLDYKEISDRIEFNAIDAAKRMKNKSFASYLANNTKLSVLSNILKDNKSDLSSQFKSYLFGFQIGKDIYLPPWNVSHFRIFSSKSEFFPFGRSLFINSISPFRQLKSSKNMMALARIAKFPKEHFEVETSEDMTELEKWEAVNDARQEYQNLGLSPQDSDDFGVGGQIWTPEGLLKYNLIENRLNLDDIADIELLRDDMIIGTRVPKGYLVVDRSSFGTSGQSLLQQFKPFGRAVFTIQSAVLYELTQLIKTHFLITGQFDKEFTDFQLSMNFPVIEEASDRLRMKSDTLRLAGDIISAIQSSLGTRDGLPSDVVKSIFNKISFLDPEDVDKWIDASAETLLGEKLNTKIVNNKLSESEVNKIKSRLDEKVIKTAFFESMKQNGIYEGVFAKKHFVNSSYLDKTQKDIFQCLRNNEFKQIKG